MRKFILLAGTAFTITAAPALACDLEMMMGGPQRFNAFAAYGGSHASVAIATDDSQQEERSDPESERQADTADADAEAVRPEDVARTPTTTLP